MPCPQPLLTAGLTAVLLAGLSGAVAAPSAAAPASDPCSPLGDFETRMATTGGQVISGTISALGSPRRDVGGVPAAGAVDIRITPGNGLADSTETSAALVLTSSALGRAAQPRDGFGAAVAAAAVNSADECRDLLIGVPGADGGRGAVVVVPGTRTGFAPAAARWLPTDGLGLRPGDQLGTALTAVATSAGMLVVAGAPGRDLPGARNAGELVTWLFATGGAQDEVPAPTKVATVVQGSGGVRGRSERGDRFGSVIAARDIRAIDVVTVGIPDEDVGGKREAGAVVRLTFAGTRVTASRMMWAGSGLPGTPHRGDRLGAAVTTWHGLMPGASGSNALSGVGVPGRDANGHRDAGAVLVHDPHTRKWRTVTQNTRGIPDRSENGDAFGASVASAVLPGQNITLIIGTPGEDTATGANAGAVTFLNDPSLPAGQVTGLTSGDRFGTRLLLLSNTSQEEDRQDVLLVGAPGTDRADAPDAGAWLRVTQDGITDNALAAHGQQAAERLGT